MASTNKTEHLQLNQWVGTDPFRMTDFNEDNAKLDAAIANTTQAIANNSKSIQNNTTEISNNAKSIQSNATAIAALQNAGLRIAVGSYTGNGEHGSGKSCSITFLFEPKLVWIQAADSNYRALFFRDVTTASASMHVSPYNYVLNSNWSGNSLSWYDSSSGSLSDYKQLNHKDVRYVWLALG